TFLSYELMNALQEHPGDWVAARFRCNPLGRRIALQFLGHPRPLLRELTLSGGEDPRYGSDLVTRNNILAGPKLASLEIHDFPLPSCPLPSLTTLHITLCDRVDPIQQILEVISRTSALERLVLYRGGEVDASLTEAPPMLPLAHL